MEKKGAWDTKIKVLENKIFNYKYVKIYACIILLSFNLLFNSNLSLSFFTFFNFDAFLTFVVVFELKRRRKCEKLMGFL